MARLDRRFAENAEGDFYVDRSCIDCAICRITAPETFARSDANDASFVARQPANAKERLRAAMALVACPTSSIGSVDGAPTKEATQCFPEPLAADISFCGFASKDSYGAQSYLIRRPEGNVLVDSPRATPVLMDRLEAAGGVKLMFLTHRDDVADHRSFAKRFGCTRILHANDVTSDTRDVEHVIEGDDPIALAPDLVAIPVPGHTKGSTALLYKTALFTGDHLFAAEDGTSLYALQSVAWWSWKRQIQSLERLRAFEFDWVLPGHEGRMRAPSTKEMRAHLERAISQAS